MTCFLRLGCVTLAVMVSQGLATRAAQGVEQTPIPSPARPGVTMAVYTQGFAAANKDRLLAVNVSTTDLAGGSSKELAAVLTFRDRPSPGKIMDSQHVGGTLRIDRDVLADGDADTGLDKLGYATNEVDEAFAALHAEAGSQFNFSNAELARWTALRSKLQGADHGRTRRPWPLSTWSTVPFWPTGCGRISMAVYRPSRPMRGRPGRRPGPARSYPRHSN